MNILLGIALACSGITSASSELTVKSDDVKIRFEMPSEELSGTIGGFEATIKFNKDNLAESSIVGSVKVKTLDTGNEGRDKHLKNDDFFSSTKYPTINFTSSGISATEDGFSMTGIMQIEDKEHEETIRFLYKDKIFSAQTKIHLTDYGVGKFSSGDEKDSEVIVSFSIPIL